MWAGFYGLRWPIVELGGDAKGVGICEIFPLLVFVYIANKMFDSHLSGSISHRWVAKAHFFGGRWISSVGKFERRPVAYLRALLSMPSISVSCRSLKISRYVACYLDLRSCSITRVL